jgi:hypothetical protein
MSASAPVPLPPGASGVVVVLGESAAVDAGVPKRLRMDVQALLASGERVVVIALDAPALAAHPDFAAHPDASDSRWYRCTPRWSWRIASRCGRAGSRAPPAPTPRWTRWRTGARCAAALRRRSPRSASGRSAG